MLCKPAPSAIGTLRCEHCGRDYPLTESAAASSTACEAEASLDEIEQMESGLIPRRAVKVTPWQLQQLMQRKGVAHLLSQQELERLFGSQVKQAASSAEHKLLIGSRLKLLFDSIGIPPCPACAERAAYMDTAHEWCLLVFGIEP